MHGIFNWTMTYQTDADIYYLYGYLYKLQPGTFKDNLSMRDLRKKKLIGWIVSNCEAKYSPRNAYVEALQKHISVDIYGSCTSIQCERNSVKG